MIKSSSEEALLRLEAKHLAAQQALSSTPSARVLAPLPPPLAALLRWCSQRLSSPPQPEVQLAERLAFVTTGAALGLLIARICFKR